ncbi:MAG: hypothetical protein AAF376_14810 [Pseudomonadota bacterium]
MDERVWTDRPLGIGERIEGADLVVTRDEPGHLTLISGDVEAAVADLAPGAPILGLGQIADHRPTAIRIARDRGLLVTDRPVARFATYDNGIAASPADGLYACLTVTGPRASALLAEATAVDVAAGSPSAAITAMGCSVLLTGVPNGGWRIRVASPMLTYVTSWINAALSA